MCTLRSSVSSVGLYLKLRCTHLHTIIYEALLIGLIKKCWTKAVFISATTVQGTVKFDELFLLPR